jgi:hypothetical protein
MTDTGTTGMDALIESIKAQGQALEKYNYAFMQILQELDKITDSLKDANTSGGDGRRDITGHISELIAEVRHSHEASRELRKLLDDHVAEFNQHAALAMREMGSQEGVIGEIAPLVRDIHAEDQVKAAKQSDKILEKFDALIVRIDAVALQLVALHTKIDLFSGVPEQVGSMWRARQGWRKTAVHIVYYLLAAGSIWVISQGLVQMGILQLKWFPH